MSVEPLIRPPDQLAAEAPLVHTRPVANRDHDGLLSGVEREGDTPYTALCAQPKSFVLLWPDPLSVPAFGRPSAGPKSSLSLACARTFVLDR